MNETTTKCLIARFGNMALSDVLAVFGYRSAPAPIQRGNMAGAKRHILSASGAVIATVTADECWQMMYRLAPLSF